MSLADDEFALLSKNVFNEEWLEKQKGGQFQIFMNNYRPATEAAERIFAKHGLVVIDSYVMQAADFIGAVSSSRCYVVRRPENSKLVAANAEEELDCRGGQAQGSATQGIACTHGREDPGIEVGEGGALEEPEGEKGGGVGQNS